MQTPTTIDCSPEAQEARRKELYRLHRRSLGSIDAADIRENSSRSSMWHAIPWLADKDSDGEAIEHYLIHSPEWGSCAFAPAVSMQLLIRWSDTMTAGLRGHLENYASRHLEGEEGATFAGYNDNFPAMSACCLALAGAYFGEPRWRDSAADILASAEALLKRRDYYSEHLSTVYSPITAAMMAEIVEYGDDPELCHTARKLEERSWLELLSHWHLASCSLAGPHSRSYERDSVAHVSNLHHALFTCFGADVVSLNSRDFLYPPPPEMVIHHEGDLDFVRAGAQWLVSPTYHPTEDGVRYLRDQALPRTEVGTAECGVFRDIVPEETDCEPSAPQPPYPPGSCRVVSHLSEHFSLGTGSRDWLNADQHDIFSIKTTVGDQQRRPQPPRVIFTRYVSGHKTPGQANYHPEMNREQNRNLFREEGRRRCVQKDNIALVTYWPKRRLEKAPTPKLALNVLIPCHFSRPHRMRLGSREVDEASLTSTSPEPIFMHEGGSFVALLPLAVDDLGRSCGTRIEPRGEYLVAEYINYEGAERSFNLPELLAIRNGFLAVAEEADGRNFDRWCTRLWETVCTENYTEHGGDLRCVRGAYQDAELEMRFNPATEFAQFVTVDGRAVE